MLGIDTDFCVRALDSFNPPAFTQLQSRVVCYNFDSRIQERDIDFLFSKYGRLESLEFRPDSAFVTYFGAVVSLST